MKTKHYAGVTASAVAQMDAQVTKGEIVQAVQDHFDESAKTSDYDGVKTHDKTEMIRKMQDFTGAIAEVKEIKHHRTVVNGNESASEFTFEFGMKDGSEILWHEIIRRIWGENGKVREEEYFQAH